MISVTWRPAGADHRTSWRRVTQVRTHRDLLALVSSWEQPALAHGALVRAIDSKRGRSLFYVADAAGKLHHAEGIDPIAWERVGINHLPGLAARITAVPSLGGLVRLCAVLARRVEPLCGEHPQAQREVAALEHAVAVLREGGDAPEDRAFSAMVSADRGPWVPVRVEERDAASRARLAILFALTAAIDSGLCGPESLAEALRLASLAVEPRRAFTRIPVSLAEAACALACLDPPTRETAAATDRQATPDVKA